MWGKGRGIPTQMVHSESDSQLDDLKTEYMQEDFVLTQPMSIRKKF